MGITTEWIHQCHHALVGLDTAPLIYYIEGHPQYLGCLDPFFDAMERGEFIVITSTITLVEVLVQPLRANRMTLMRVSRYFAACAKSDDY